VREWGRTSVEGKNKASTGLGAANYGLPEKHQAVGAQAHLTA
jgi:hypothetical protein